MNSDLEKHVDDLASLAESKDPSRPGLSALCELARALSSRLAEADDRAVSAIAKELRSLIAELSEIVPRDDKKSPYGQALGASVRDAPIEKKKPRASRRGGVGVAGDAAVAVATPRSGRRSRDRS